jgi:isopentenyl phosphate kinase
MTIVIKVGGARAVDPAGALADVSELVAQGEDVVVVHGGGSFGHHHASDAGVSTTAGTHDAADAIAISHVYRLKWSSALPLTLLHFGFAAILGVALSNIFGLV